MTYTSTLVPKYKDTYKSRNETPKSVPALKQIAGLRQFWRHITVHTVWGTMAVLFNQNITAAVEPSHKSIQKCDISLFIFTMDQAQETILQN